MLGPSQREKTIQCSVVDDYDFDYDDHRGMLAWFLSFRIIAAAWHGNVRSFVPWAISCFDFPDLVDLWWVETQSEKECVSVCNPSRGINASIDR